MDNMDYLLISVGKSIYCGQVVGLEHKNNCILVKQSKDSNIILSIPIYKINYLILKNEDKITGITSIKNYIEQFYRDKKNG